MTRRERTNPKLEASGRRRVASMLADGLLFSLSLLGTLGATELLLRWYRPLYPSPYQPDDTVLVRHVPGAKKAFTRLAINGGQRIVSEFNSQGFRGPELRNPTGVRRVLVYGDSNVQAEFSELAATFPKQLEARLRATGDVEAINGGVVGDGPDQVVLRLANDAPQVRPELVIVVVFADNDFGDLIRNRIYRLGEHGELEPNHYGLAPQLRATLLHAAFPHGWRRLQLERYGARLWGLISARRSASTLTPGSTLVGHYVEGSLALNQSTYRDYIAGDSGSQYSADPFFDYYDADIALLPDSASARYKIALMEQVLIRLRDTAARASTALMLVILPSAIDACDHYDFQVDRGRYPQYQRRRLSTIVEDIAKRNHIPYANLWDAFSEPDANRYYFHGGDDHWNDAGQAKAADLVAQIIVERGLLPPPRQ